jgi:hypothetical protein
MSKLKTATRDNPPTTAFALRRWRFPIHNEVHAWAAASAHPNIVVVVVVSSEPLQRPQQLTDEVIQRIESGRGSPLELVSREATDA